MFVAVEVNLVTFSFETPCYCERLYFGNGRKAASLTVYFICFKVSL